MADGTTVLEAAAQLGTDLDTVCGGRGICGRCQIEVAEGEFAKWALTVNADALSPWTATEQGYEGKRPLRTPRRLGCAARIHGDVVLDVPPESQIHKQVIRKSVDVGELRIDPLYTLSYETSGRAETEDGLVSVIRRGDDVVTTIPQLIDRLVGVAVDVGSTTIAAHLIDLASGDVLATAGRMNPQIRFGEDLMSRVSYVMMNPGGDADLTSAVRGALGELIEELLQIAQVDPDAVIDITLVGNPIMHHLFLGLDPTPLGQAPFPLTIEGAHACTALDLDLDLAHAQVYVAPCIAGHVGADTAAAILNEGPHRGAQVQLLVDVGTNAEIVLGNADQLWACSSPTGPAFEGAQISSGQRATAGAIERVRIDRASHDVQYKVIGCDLWSNEAGFADEISDTGVTGICGSGVIEAISEMVACGIIDHAGAIRGELSSGSDRVVADGRTFNFMLTNDIAITQADVRAIQLAKAALKAGIDLLMEHAGIHAVDEIRLAGAFGAHIDPSHAIIVGLIPDIDVARVRSVGNSAGSGAVRLLLSKTQRDEVEDVVEHVIKIETATEPRFQEHFVTALGFPHSTAPLTGDSSGRRRRRRRPQASDRPMNQTAPDPTESDHV